MKKLILVFTTLFTLQGIGAQQMYVLPEGFESSGMSSFENLNGVKAPGGKQTIRPREMPMKA
jgi:hypothetical protein